MEILQLTLLPILLLAIIFLSGLGLSSYIFKDLDKEAQFVLAPIIGTATIVFLTLPLIFIGCTGKTTSVITAICLLIVDFIRIRHVIAIFRSIHLKLVVICAILISFLYYILIPFYKLGYVTTSTYHIADSTTYIPAAEYIINNSIYDINKEIQNPLSNPSSNTHEEYMALILFHQITRWGSLTILAFLHVISSYDIVQIFSVLSYIFYIISGLLVYKIIDSYLKRTSLFITILLSLFYLFNYLLFWIAIDNQLAQTITIPFFLSIIYLTNHDNFFKKGTSLRMYFGFSLIANAILSLYPEYAPFIFAPFLMFCFYRFVKNKRTLYGAVFIFLIFFINPISTYLGLKSIFLFSKDFAGSGIPMPNLNLFEILGFSNAIDKSSLTPSPIQNIFEILIYLGSLCTIIFLLIKKTSYFLFSLLYLILFLIVKYKFNTSYTVFKYITYMLPFVIVSFLFFIKYLYIKYKTAQFPIFFLLLFCTFTQFKQLNLFVNQLNKNSYVVSRQYQSLIDFVDNNQSKKIIYLGSVDFWSANWMKYYLKNNALYLFQEKKTEIQPYILVDYPKNHFDDYVMSDHNVLSNQYYQLYKSNYLLIFDQSTWYPVEVNQQKATWRWMNENGLIHMYVNTPGVYRLTLNVSPFQKERHIDIKLNNEILINNLTVKGINNSIEIPLKLINSKNIITINPQEPPDRLPQSPDQRKFSIKVTGIKFEKISD